MDAKETQSNKESQDNHFKKKCYPSFQLKKKKNLPHKKTCYARFMSMSSVTPSNLLQGRDFVVSIISNALSIISCPPRILPQPSSYVSSGHIRAQLCYLALWLLDFFICIYVKRLFPTLLRLWSASSISLRTRASLFHKSRDHFSGLFRPPEPLLAPWIHCSQK